MTGTETRPTAGDDRLVALLGAPRAAIVRHLRSHAEAGVAEVAALLGVSDVAARRHLAVLVDDGMVVRDATPGPAQGPGRPAARYRLTDRGRELFPQRYAAVASELLEFMTSRQGRDEFRRYLRWRLERESERYRGAVTAEALPQRLEQLADALTEAGYEATVAADGDGYVLTQDHCAIEDVARHHPQMCHYEAATFSRVLGEDVTVQRRVTKAEGAPACVCQVRPRRGAATTTTTTDRPVTRPDSRPRATGASA